MLRRATALKRICDRQRVQNAIGKEYKKEYKIEDDKFILSVDEEIIELKMNYIKSGNNKLILHDIDDNSEILFKRIVID